MLQRETRPCDTILGAMYFCRKCPACTRDQTIARLKGETKLNRGRPISCLIVERLTKFGRWQQEAGKRSVRHEGRVIKLFRDVSPTGVLDQFLRVISSEQQLGTSDLQ